MKQLIVHCFAFLLIVTGCKKTTGALFDKAAYDSSIIDNSDFTKYMIKAGQHSADLNYYKAVDVSELKFIVRFDSRRSIIVAQKKIKTTLISYTVFRIMKLITTSLVPALAGGGAITHCVYLPMYIMMRL